MSDGCFETCLGVFVGGVLGALAGAKSVEWYTHGEAVRAGRAEYVLVGIDGDTEFRWIDCPCAECATRREKIKQEESKP